MFNLSNVFVYRLSVAPLVHAPIKVKGIVDGENLLKEGYILLAGSSNCPAYSKLALCGEFPILTVVYHSLGFRVLSIPVKQT